MAKVEQTRLDRAITSLFPKWGAQRHQYRLWNRALGEVDLGGRRGRRGAQATYRGGTQTRTDRPWVADSSERGFSIIDRQATANMRDRARKVDRNNAIGHGILNRLVDNVIGEGMTLQARTTSEAFNTESEERYKAWEDQCDIRGLLTGPELDRHAYRGHERDGDVGILLAEEGGKSRLQLISGDLIKTPAGKSTSDNVIDGVQTNRVGRPIRFYVDGAANPISANDFIFYPRLKRGATQLRGESCFAQVFPLLDQIDGYIDAVVIAARLGAIFGLIFKEANAAKNFGALSTLTNSQGDAQKAITLENGIIKYVGNDDDVVQVQAQQPMNQTPDFIRSMLRQIGLPMDMPLELVLIDYSQANLSSIRAGIQQFYRAMRCKQTNYKRVVKQRVYRWWVSREVKAGNFVSAVPDDYWAHDWQSSGWQYHEPVKELQAAAMEKDLNLNTARAQAAALGRDYDAILIENERERKRLEAAGMPLARSNMTRDEGASNGQVKVSDETPAQSEADQEQDESGDGDADKDNNDDE